MPLKDGVDAVFLKFQQAGLNITKEQVVSMKKQFEELDKTYEYYLFFE